MRLFTAILCATAATAGAAFPPEQIEFFEKQIRPILVEQCYKCHGPEKQKADLRVDSRAALLKGSDTGAVVVPGQPEKGSFIKSIRHEGDNPMPEKADKMPDAQIAALTEWVRQGLPWPENDGPATKSNAALAQTH